ncbi:MAG TPA: PQQ-dependent sugar dehydrogenase [Chloroflexota bacterium]|nr:PQQ-dependent sugar dehydrogenase [Chloroflexota bacterium]
MKLLRLASISAVLLSGCALMGSPSTPAAASTPASSQASTQASTSAAPSQQAECQYVLGFKVLHDLIPDIMGPCVENEQPAPNGDSVQRTASGLAVYRKADNWTAFTDGHRTWINGPQGLQSRLNTERFPWEADAGQSGATVVSAFNPAAVTLRLDTAWTGFRGPLGLTHAGDGSGRLFVVEKPGTIRVIKGGGVLPAPFLDLSDRVRSEGYEQGLLGLAFHPQFAQNGQFVVNYTDRSGDTMIVRFSARPGSDTADLNSAQTILHVNQPARNHNGGHLLFGPDGYLYIGMGDGGGGGDQFGNAQNPSTLLGAMLRIDVNRAEGGRPYAIPADNPFVGQSGWRPEIWAYGLRNPWRYTFDRATGDLYIADVGQNAYEEVNFQPAGAGGQNYGWPRMEATHCFPPSTECDRSGLTIPIGEYGRTDGISITGGYVYRGQAQPQLQGAYIFGDFGSGKIWTLHRDASESWVQTLMTDSPAQISSFGEDEAGELFLTSLVNGNVYRVVAVAR